MKTAFTIAILLLLVVAGCKTAPSTIPLNDSANQSPDDGRLAAIECPAGHPKGDGPCTMEYNPVCSDGVTYGNVCGACRFVDRYFPGECANAGNDTPPPALPEGYVECTEEQRNQPCTKEYRPVCATQDNGIRCITTPCDSTDYRTFGNACSACSDPTVYGYVPGECSVQPVEVKQGTHLICEDGECRDVNGCPEGYDEYPGQLKKMCVKHAGEAEIKAWVACTNADSCPSENCVFATRITTGEEMAWSGAQNAQGFYADSLRCVPEDYKTFLLHTSGASGIDENGELYTVIA